MIEKILSIYTDECLNFTNNAISMRLYNRDNNNRDTNLVVFLPYALSSFVEYSTREFCVLSRVNLRVTRCLLELLNPEAPCNNHVRYRGGLTSARARSSSYAITAL